MRVEGTSDFHRAASALNGLDRKVRLGVQKGLRATAKPLGEEMVQSGAADMPKRGGLSDRVAASSVNVLASLAGANPRVFIRLKTREGYDLNAMDRGSLRHPVFGTGAWVEQSVPDGGFTRAFNDGAPEMRNKIEREVKQALDAAAGEV